MIHLTITAVQSIELMYYNILHTSNKINVGHNITIQLLFGQNMKTIFTTPD